MKLRVVQVPQDKIDNFDMGESDPLDPAKGVIIGIALSLVLWGVFIITIYRVF